MNFSHHKAFSSPVSKGHFHCEQETIDVLAHLAQRLILLLVKRHRTRPMSFRGALFMCVSCGRSSKNYQSVI
jgi:hypothetical protein